MTGATVGQDTDRARASGREEQALALLESVMDPCSVAAGRPVSIVAMGLLVDLEVSGTTARVGLRTTFPGCTMAPKFAEAAEEQLRTLPGIENVVVTIDPTFTWTPGQARPEARALHVQPGRQLPLVTPWARRTSRAVS